MFFNSILNSQWTKDMSNLSLHNVSRKMLFSAKVLYRAFLKPFLETLMEFSSFLPSIPLSKT